MNVWGNDDLHRLGRTYSRTVLSGFKETGSFIVDDLLLSGMSLTDWNAELMRVAESHDSIVIHFYGHRQNKNLVCD